jgi:cobalamin-dependent methionine synthase I
MDMGIVNPGMLAVTKRFQGLAGTRRRRAAQSASRRDRATGCFAETVKKTDKTVASRRQLARRTSRRAIVASLVKGITDFIDQDVEEAEEVRQAAWR